jgi:FMN phosphatase YigB (HAD superfamily)
MSRVVLFDLGDTLVDQHTNEPLPGAPAMLTSLAGVDDAAGRPVRFGLVSDWIEPHGPADVGPLRQRYLDELKASGLDTFFEPFESRITLSTEVGAFKPAPAIFREALRRLDPALTLADAVFVTENKEHVEAARGLGMAAIRFRGPGQTTGDVATFPELLEALRMIVGQGPCVKQHDRAVGIFASPASKSKHLDPKVTALIAQVDANRLHGRIQRLVDFGTRWTFSPEIGRVPAWIRDQFLGMGYADTEVRLQPFSVQGAPAQANVLCGPDATSPGFVLVCAHYDAISEHSAVSTPGADDNGSGIAVILEVAELLKTVSLRRGVLFAAFGGEEQGLHGSTACAAIAAAEGWRIDCVVNLDMIAFQQAGQPHLVRVEYDQGNLDPGNDAAAKAFGLQMAQIARDYTSLEVEHTDIWNSDYMPFEAQGYACIGVYEAGENPGYHKTTDTLDVLDMGHLAEVTRMVLATVYTMAS